MDENKKKGWILINYLLVTIIFSFVIYSQLKVGDFQPHIEWARKLGDSGYLYLRANILFQRLVLVVRDLMPFNFLARISTLIKQIIDIKSYDISAYIVTILAYLATFYFSFQYISQNVILKDDKKKNLIVSISTFIVMLVGPVFLFSYPERQYLGYFDGNPFHNPTYILMKPFALGFFLLVINSLYRKTTWKTIILAGLFLFLGTLAKPSFTISFIPAIFIVAVLVNYSKVKELNYKFLLISVMLTSIIVLISQYMIMYTGSRGDRVLISPFEAILTFIPNISLVLLSALLSILFPLTMTILYWSDFKDVLSFKLVLVNFILSLFIVYIFTEQVDMRSLNFWWTPMMAVYLLFLVTVSVFINKLFANGSIRKIHWKNGILAGLLILHFICGIIFYINSLGPISPVQ